MDTSSLTTKQRLLQLLQEAMAAAPTTPLSLSDLAHTLGVSRERVRVLYRQLAREYPLPPVKNKGSWSKETRRKHTVRKQIKEQEVIQKVKALRDKGVYYQQIIQEHGIPESQLWKATKKLSQAGETSRKLTSPETLAFEAAVRSCRAQGMTGDEIAQKTGKHPGSVYAALHRLDVPLSKRTRKTGESSHKLKNPKVVVFEAKVQAYSEQGMAVPEIGRKIGRPVKTIYAALHRLDIPLSKRTMRSREEKMAPSPLSTKKYLLKLHLLKLLQHANDTEPNTPVSLSKIARTLSVPRQYVHKLYHQLAVEYPLPPVAKPGFGQLDQEAKLAIAKLGGKAVHAKGTAHRLIEEEGKRAVQNSLLKLTLKHKA